MEQMEIIILMVLHVCWDVCHCSQLNNSGYNIISGSRIGRNDMDVKTGGVDITKVVNLENRQKQTTLTETNSVSNFIDIIWLNSTTESISIRWKTSPSYNVTGYIQNSYVEYFPPGGRFTSHPLGSKTREYTFSSLDVDTLYTVCVHMSEVYGPSNSSSITHSKCLKINTINYIRKDSVVIAMVTLGYYIFMGLLGYSQWKRKLWAMQNRNKNRAKRQHSDTNNRWKDLVEKERLMAKPGCSIELYTI